MHILIPIAHIVGSIIALFVFGFFVAAVAGWEETRNQNRILEETSVTLGVKIDELNSEENLPKIIELSSKRYSSELLRNRVSDFCGIIRTLWVWTGNILQIGILIAVIWFTVSDSQHDAVYSWWIVAVAIFFWLTSVVFSLICKLITGRYPGEAKIARKIASEWLNARDNEIS